MKSLAKKSILAIIILNTIGMVNSTVLAEPAPHVAIVKAQSSGSYQYRIGDMQITTLSDGTVPQDLPSLLRHTHAQEIDSYLDKSFRKNPIEASINAFLIDTGNKLILVDTGAGNLFGSDKGGKLLANLEAEGYKPNQITDILLTHIHTDHSGGLSIKGKMIFSNATIHVSKADIDFFLNPAYQNGKNCYYKQYFTNATETIKPYMDAGKIKTFEGRVELLPGITAIPTPGHTPGHSFYQVESKDKSVLFIGDLIHNAEVQFAKPGVGIIYDVNDGQAVSQRKKQLILASQSRSLLAGAHLPFPGLGHISKNKDDSYTFVPVLYENR